MSFKSKYAGPFKMEEVVVATAAKSSVELLADKHVSKTQEVNCYTTHTI